MISFFRGLLKLDGEGELVDGLDLLHETLDEIRAVITLFVIKYFHVFLIRGGIDI